MTFSSRNIICSLFYFYAYNIKKKIKLKIHYLSKFISKISPNFIREEYQPVYGPPCLVQSMPKSARLLLSLLFCTRDGKLASDWMVSEWVSEWREIGLARKTKWRCVVCGWRATQLCVCPFAPSLFLGNRGGSSAPPPPLRALDSSGRSSGLPISKAVPTRAWTDSDSLSCFKAGSARFVFRAASLSLRSAFANCFAYFLIAFEESLLWSS